MISEMLDLDRLHSGRISLQVEPVDLVEVVTAVISSLRPTATRHDLRTRLDPGLPMVTADRDRLTQVVTNLLANAIKYSPDGGEIVVAAWGEGEDVRLSVSDQGIGIPLEALESIFERYTRVEPAAGRTIEGTGLGLPIAKQIVELHGGQIWAESADGGGSIFHVAIPRTPAVGATSQAGPIP
jgi:signal transduction histidine kinase